MSTHMLPYLQCSHYHSNGYPTGHHITLFPDLVGPRLLSYIVGVDMRG